ncbi:MAG: 50S ribosomal protein L11 methyltransferase, partial [Solirubrobacterales bacterium]
AAPSAPTIVANLVAPVLRDVAALLANPPRTLIISGLLLDEAEAVAQAFAPHDLETVKRLDSGDWSALLLAR